MSTIMSSLPDATGMVKDGGPSCLDNLRSVPGLFEKSSRHILGAPGQPQRSENNGIHANFCFKKSIYFFLTYVYIIFYRRLDFRNYWPFF
jgi:hypothetical protein